MSFEPGRRAGVVAGLTAVLVVLVFGLRAEPPGWWGGHATARAASRQSAAPAADPDASAHPGVSSDPATATATDPATATAGVSGPGGSADPATTTGPGAAADPSGSTGTTGPAPGPSQTPLLATGTPTGLATSTGAAVPGLALPAGVVARTSYLTYGGFPRSYTTFTPAGGSVDLPMMMFLSGTTATLATEVPRDGLLSEVAAGRLSLVYPAGLDLRWNVDGICCTTADRPRADDADFVREVASLATTALAPDPARLYLAGYSAGGRVAWQIACAGATPYAAIATYGAAPENACPNSGDPLPVLIGFGAKDPDQPIAGMPANTIGTHPPALENVDTWRIRDGCPLASTVSVVAGEVREQEWAGCTPAGRTVTYALWLTAIHVLPSAPKYPTAAAFGTIAWTFLQQYDRSWRSSGPR